MLGEFRRFLLRGNVVDLAVALMLGAAFGAVVTSLVRDLVTPLVAAVAGKPDFSRFAFIVHGAEFRYGEFLNALFALVLLAAVLFFFVVKPANAIALRARSVEPKAEALTKPCPECLADVPAAARRCRHCTSPLS